MGLQNFHICFYSIISTNFFDWFKISILDLKHVPAHCKAFSEECATKSLRFSYSSPQPDQKLKMATWDLSGSKKAEIWKIKAHGAHALLQVLTADDTNKWYIYDAFSHLDKYLQKDFTKKFQNQQLACLNNKIMRKEVAFLLIWSYFYNDI